MRGLLACAMLAAMTTAATAQVSDDVVRIGVLTDLSSWGRDNSGPGSVEAARRRWCPVFATASSVTG